MKLLIISHTEHFRRADGHIAGWGPTVREINYLAEIFEEIYHVAPLHSGEAPPSCMVYESTRIHFVSLNPSGGHSLAAKAGILLQAPATIRTVMKTLRKVDLFQFRAPTGIGVYLLPWITTFCRKPGWVKYAGNWMQKNPPKGYAFQRWWLSKNFMRRVVTINGEWPGQPPHCISFENPTLNEKDRSDGVRVLSEKSYSESINFCFVGRLDEAKGVDRIIDGFRTLGRHPRLGDLHFVGDSSQRENYQIKSKNIDMNIYFDGFLPREDVNAVYEKSHILLLLSKSEGFPKVVAEAANYGCIPIVTNVGSLGQYIENGVNGFCLNEDECNAKEVAKVIKKILDTKDLLPLAKKIQETSQIFSYRRYQERIKNEIIGEFSCLTDV